MSLSTLRRYETMEELDNWVRLAKSGSTQTFAHVSDQLFDEVIALGASIPRTPCTDAELDMMNAMLGMNAYSQGKTALLSKVDCVGCNRSLNFYDVFVQGVEKHGLGFMKRFATGPNKVRGDTDGEQTLCCSGCGQSTPCTREFVTDQALYGYGCYNC